MTKIKTFLNWIEDYSGRLLLIVLGVAVILFGGKMVSDYERAWVNRPQDETLTLWRTAKAEVLPSLSFEPGKPSRVVSMDEFKQTIGDQLYQLSYDSHWKTGGELSKAYGSGGGAVIYQARITLNDGDKIYVVAYQWIPYRYSDSAGWKYGTSFNFERGEFVQQATSLSDQLWFWGWLAKIAGSALALGSFVSLFWRRKTPAAQAG